MILGIDVGYSHTKVATGSENIIFKSTVDEGSLDDVISAIKVEYLEKDYVVGENIGLYDTSINKITSNTFKILLYTSIAKSMKNSSVEDIQIVTGLPAQYYQDQKNDLINEYKGKKITMVLNDKPKMFTIKDLIVFPQSAGILLTNPDELKGNVAIIDIGGYTVDVSFFNDKNLKRLETIELGMNTLANSIVKQIKKEYSVSYDVLQIDEILNNREIIKDNKTVKIDKLIDDVLRKHAILIYNRLKGLKDFDINKHVYIGGGSLRLEKFIKELDNVETIDENSIFTNAKAFYKIGVEKFGNKED